MHLYLIIYSGFILEHELLNHLKLRLDIHL